MAEVSDAVGGESEGGGSLWEKLEPPVRRSPLTLNSAVIIKPETNTEVSEELQTTGREIPGMSPPLADMCIVLGTYVQTSAESSSMPLIWISTFFACNDKTTLVEFLRQQSFIKVI